MARFEDLTLDQWDELAYMLQDANLDAVNERLEEVQLPDGFYVRYGKRALDLIISGAALLVVVPINLVLALCTLADVGHPILFKQQRAGKDNRAFELIKFRNMSNECDERGELLPASERVTSFGKFMRRTSLDELFNFWNIFKGDMSLIGPRPLPTFYSHRYNLRHAARLKVKPGLECPPRELGHYWSWQEQLDNDVWYVEHLSFKTDLYMCWCLLRYALDRRSSEARSDGDERGSFLGYNAEGKVLIESDISQEMVDEILAREGRDAR